MNRIDRHTPKFRQSFQTLDSLPQHLQVSLLYEFVAIEDCTQELKIMSVRARIKGTLCP